MAPKNILNAIPTSLDDLVSLGSRALHGAQLYGAAVGLFQNTDARIAADLYTVTGGTDNAAPRGKQGLLGAAIASRAAARATLDAAMKEGRKYCNTCVDLLKNRYGRIWGPLWAAAGFGWGTLRIPNDPMARLIDLREYFLRNPTHASEDLNVSADRCNAVAGEISAARAALDGQKAAVHAVRVDRRAAQRQLRTRLTGLRNELAQLLKADDSRWYQFGFRRPADGRIPAPVEGLKVEQGAAGELHVTWDAATRAVNYRVVRQVDGVDAAPVEVGLFADRFAMVRGLPAGKLVKFQVSARNDAGESLPAEAGILAA